MKIAKRILNEVKQVISLDGSNYQINIQRAIKALIDYEFENPDMGNSDDFKNDAERKRRLTKDMKGLDVQTVKEQIELYVGEGEILVKDLIKSKVISKI